jgi:arylsulfatase
MYIRWYAENIWLFVPVQQKIRAFFSDFDKYPSQDGSSLNAAGINYNTLKAAAVMKRLKQLEIISRPGN